MQRLRALRIDCWAHATPRYGNLFPRFPLTKKDLDMSQIDKLAVNYLGIHFEALGGPAHERLILTIRVDAADTACCGLRRNDTMARTRRVIGASGARGERKPRTSR